MYYSMHQSNAVHTAADRRRHTLSSALRPFLIRFSLMFSVLLIAFSAGAIVQANAGPAATGTDASAAQSVAAAPSPIAITVEQGDTLWNIAQANADKGTDVRSYIGQIKRLNHLAGTTLKVGQKLLLP